MPRPKPEGETKNFQFRMTVEETARWWELFLRAKERAHGFLKETDFNRLLLGLNDNLTVVTEKDRAYFRQAGKEQAKLIGRAASTKPHITEAAPQVKRK